MKHEITPRKQEQVPLVVEAVIYLKQRYSDICLEYPLTRDYMTEAQYVVTNLPYKLRNMRAAMKKTSAF